MSSFDLEYLVEQIITSPQALRMRNMVTKGFYDRSFVGLWLYQVIGSEYDDMEEWAKLLRYEAYPQTCTWSIGIWEFISGLEPMENLPEDPEQALQMRRQRLLVKRWTRPSVNPARTEAAVSSLLPSGYDVRVTENVAPHTFRVDIDGVGGSKNIYDFRNIVNLLRSIKQSHLSFQMRNVLTTEFEYIIRAAGVTFPGSIMITKLTQYIPADKHEQEIHTVAFRSSIMQTTMGPIHYEHKAVISLDGVTYEDAKLQLPGGEIVDMVIQMLNEDMNGGITQDVWVRNTRARLESAGKITGRGNT